MIINHDDVDIDDDNDHKDNDFFKRQLFQLVSHAVYVKWVDINQTE